MISDMLFSTALPVLATCVVAAGIALAAPAPTTQPLENFTLDYDTPTDPALQAKLHAIDRDLRGKYEMTTANAAVGLLDLNRLRLAMIHPDRIEYAASLGRWRKPPATRWRPNIRGSSG